MRTCSVKRAPHANREHAATTCTRAREAIMRPAMSMAIACSVPVVVCTTTVCGASCLQQDGLPRCQFHVTRAGPRTANLDPDNSACTVGLLGVGQWLASAACTTLFCA